MSRPPRPISTTPTKQALVAHDGVLDYLPLDYDDLVELARGTAPAGGVGDVATAFYELSAVVAHLLGVYQDRYAGEAFLRSAQSPRSLIKHGRRLGYEPDPGTAATGYVHFVAGPRAAGTLPAGITLATAPPPGTEPQEFQTTAARDVRFAWNRIEVADDVATDLPIADAASGGRWRLELQGTGHGVVAGELAALVGGDVERVIDIAEVIEDRGRGVTVLRLSSPLTESEASRPASAHAVVARPALEAHLFGWDADPLVFPPFELERAVDRDDSGDEPKAGAAYHYQIVAEGPVEVTAHDIFLSEEMRTIDDGSWLVALQQTAEGKRRRELVRVSSPPASVAVGFVRSETIALPGDQTLAVERTLTGTVTRLALHRDGAAVSRADLGMRTPLAGGWRVRAPLVTSRLRGRELLEGASVPLVGDHTALAPGMLVALTSRDGRVAQIVELLRVAAATTSAPSVPEVPVTEVAFRGVTTRPASHQWIASATIVVGNVVPVVHGTLVDETVGGSDGVTPFLRLALRKAPLSYVVSGDRLVADLELRVDGVRWERVADLTASTASDRHYRLDRDETGATSIVFGDGRRGAIPPSGQKHIRAVYRIGHGVVGNVGAEQIRRIAKGHPLVTAVTNPVATAGGTEPAGADDVRTQAVRPLRTFDRAASVSDHADLALLFPGVARAAARFTDAVELVVATGHGTPLTETGALAAFLDARRDTSLPLRLVPPVAADIHVELRLEIDAAFDRRRVADAVRDALTGPGDLDSAPGLFSFAGRQLGQPAHASEVYRRVTAVPGVTFCELLHFAPSELPRVCNDAIACRDHSQWLRLVPSNLRLAVAGLVESESAHV